MPIIKSAKKRVRVSAKANDRNKDTRLTLRTAMKLFVDALKSGKNVSEAQNSAQSALDVAVKKGIIHKNKAARKKAQLAKAASATGSKPVAKARVAKTPVAKKAVVKVTPTKKTSVKKATTKAVSKKAPIKKK
jgi:small subunit ribosomal protein S20